MEKREMQRSSKLAVKRIEDESVIKPGTLLIDSFYDVVILVVEPHQTLSKCWMTRYVLIPSHWRYGMRIETIGRNMENLKKYFRFFDVED